MPSECRVCAMTRYFSVTGTTVCIATLATLANNHKTIQFEGRHEKCPLVEPPEKHGRLIDADAYVSRMEEKCDYEKALDPYVMSVCRGGIKLMPTIVEAEDGE